MYEIILTYVRVSIDSLFEFIKTVIDKMIINSICVNNLCSSKSMYMYYFAL